MRLDSKPTSRHLDELICCRIASSWDQLALHLGMEQHVILAVKEEHRHHCEQACHDVLDRWIKGERGTGRQHRTWHSILTALRECGEQELAGQLRIG